MIKSKGARALRLIAIMYDNISSSLYGAFKTQRPVTRAQKLCRLRTGVYRSVNEKANSSFFNTGIQ
jgi:hypothetical protein